MTLTFADIERWDAGSVREVFHAATGRAQVAAMAQLTAVFVHHAEVHEQVRRQRLETEVLRRHPQSTVIAQVVDQRVIAIYLNDKNKVERVANTPSRALPPSRGGRTVGFQPCAAVAWNTKISQTWFASQTGAIER